MQEDALIRTTNGSTAELDVPAIDHSFRALREVGLPHTVRPRGGRTTTASGSNTVSRAAPPVSRG